MKKFLKLLLKIILISVLLFFIILVLLTVFVDVNQYKSQLIALVKEETGLTLEINGDMKLSFYSGVKFKARKIRIAHEKSLIADIEFLSFGIPLSSVYLGKPEITPVYLEVNEFNMSRDKLGNINFLPLLKLAVNSGKTKAKNTMQADSGELGIEELSVNNIHASIGKFTYLDDRESLSLILNKTKAFLSALPIIDQAELVIDDPRILVAYSYDGLLEVKHASLNHSQINNLSLKLTDHMGDFVAKELAFSFIQEGKEHKSPLITIDAKGQFQFKLAYHTPQGASEPDWRQPDMMKVEHFDFTFPALSLTNEQLQIKTDNSHLVFKEAAIFENRNTLLMT